MLTYFELRNGVQFILDGQPYEVLEFKQMGKAQDVVVAQTKIRNLINGKTLYRTFHQQDRFEEAEISKKELQYIYNHRDKYVFCDVQDPSKRFEFTKGQVGESIQFVKPNKVVTALVFQDKIIRISLPIKVQLKVTDAPPGFKGDTAQGGTKLVTLETGATVQAPLFVEAGDILEINTDTGEYSKRVGKGE
jgi:elongation factor P